MFQAIGRVASPSAALGRAKPLDLRSAAELLRPLFERRTSEMLRLLHPRLADDLAAAFARLAAAARAQVGTLARLAESPDTEIPVDVEREINAIAARVAWQRTAGACAIAIFDSALALARPFREAEPIPLAAWVDGCVGALNREEFREDTTLKGVDVEIAINTAVRSLLSWPDLDDHIPAFVRGTFLTVKPTADGVLLARGEPLMVFPDQPQRNALDRIDTDHGVAALSVNPGQSVTLIAAPGDHLVEESIDGVCVAAYELGDGPVVGFVKSSATIVWDPDAMSVQQVGPGVLFNPKVGEHGLIFRLGTEGLSRQVMLAAEDRAADFQPASLVVEQ